MGMNGAESVPIVFPTSHHHRSASSTMGNIEKALGREGVIDWPDDIARLRKYVPELAPYSDMEIDTIWRYFSTEDACAQFLTVPEREDGGFWVKRFKEWIKE